MCSVPLIISPEERVTALKELLEMPENKSQEKNIRDWIDITIMNNPLWPRTGVAGW